MKNIVTLIFSLVIAGFAIPALAAINPETPVMVAKTGLTIDVTANVASVPQKGIVQYAITVTNFGSVKAVHVSIAGNLPNGFSYVNPADASRLANLGDIAFGRSTTVVIQARVAAATATGRYAYEPTVRASNADSVQGAVAVNVVKPQVLGAMDVKKTAIPSTALPKWMRPVVYFYGLAQFTQASYSL